MLSIGSELLMANVREKEFPKAQSFMELQEKNSQLQVVSVKIYDIFGRDK